METVEFTSNESIRQYLSDHSSVRIDDVAACSFCSFLESLLTLHCFDLSNELVLKVFNCLTYIGKQFYALAFVCERWLYASRLFINKFQSQLDTKDFILEVRHLQQYHLANDRLNDKFQETISSLHSSLYADLFLPIRIQQETKKYSCLSIMNFSYQQAMNLLPLQKSVFEINFLSDPMNRTISSLLLFLSGISFSVLDLTTVRFTPQAFTTLGFVIENNKQLRVLYLCDKIFSIERETALNKILLTENKITLLDLSYSHLSMKSVEILQSGIAENSTLRVLRLCGNVLADFGTNSLSHALQYNNTLECLNLSKNRISSGVISVAHLIKKNRSLLSIDLSENLINSDGAASLALALKKNSELRALILSENLIGSVGGSMIAKGLKKNIGLQVLDLSHNRIGDFGCASFALSLYYNKTLKVLRLEANRIACFGLNEIGLALEVNSTLRSLDLAKNRMIADALPQFAHSVARNKGLFYLNLSLNRLSSVGGNAISEIIALNKTLFELDISVNSFGINGLLDICVSLEKNKSLRVLRMAQNDIKCLPCVVQSLMNNYTLMKIDLHDNGLAFRELKELVNVFKRKRNSLTHINVDSAGFSLDVENFWTSVLSCAPHVRQM